MNFENNTVLKHCQGRTLFFQRLPGVTSPSTTNFQILLMIQHGAILSTRIKLSMAGTPSAELA